MTDWHYFWLGDTPDVMTTCDSEKYNRGGCCGVFTHKASGIQLFVMNGHGCLDDDANRIYAHVYVDREILYNTLGLPSFFVGDMNETPNEAVESPYGTFTGHWKDSLKETAQVNRSGPNNTYNGFSSQSGLRREDHIFIRGSKIVLKHYTIDNSLFDGGLFASDHFPVYIDAKVLK
jgi:endonuclease/exonuclease/phosphatase family metal-dependent hydrolase